MEIFEDASFRQFKKQRQLPDVSEEIPAEQCRYASDGINQS